MEDLSEEASFAMGYIDDDDIPELLVAENSGQADGIHVYAFKDGSVFTEFELVYSHNLEGEIVLFFGDNIYRRIY